MNPTDTFPGVVGMGVSGTDVQLPTDEDVLNHPEFKERGFAVGSEVATVSTSLSISWYSPSHTLCTQWKKGSLSEYTTFPCANIAAVCNSAPVAPPGAVLLQSSTAVTFMTEAYNVKAGDTVLVHTVAGRLGLLFAQIAKARGATVIGTRSQSNV
jgi:NADPH2:quinone reductase